MASMQCCQEKPKSHTAPPPPVICAPAHHPTKSHDLHDHAKKGHDLHGHSKGHDEHVKLGHDHAKGHDNKSCNKSDGHNKHKGSIVGHAKTEVKKIKEKCETKKKVSKSDNNNEKCETKKKVNKCDSNNKKEKKEKKCKTKKSGDNSGSDSSSDND